MRECRLYLTYRSEYLVLQDLCVGVRDRVSGHWLPLHAAACSTVLGPAHALDSDPAIPSPVRVGEQMYLRPSIERVVTGPIIAIEEPPARVVREAERQWHELFQPSDPRLCFALLGPSQR